MDDSSPYYKESNQSQAYYEPSYFTQYGGKFSKRQNRKSSSQFNREQTSGSLASSMAGKFEMHKQDADSASPPEPRTQVNSNNTSYKQGGQLMNHSFVLNNFKNQPTNSGYPVH